jgi:hypothetical protein
MNESDHKIVVEMHGCIVCAKIFSVLAVYTPEGKRVDCTVTSPDGHLVPDERQILVACDSHPAEKIEAAHQRWQSRNDEEV